MNKIMSQCGFASTTFASGATTAIAGITVKATKPTFTASGSGSSTPTGSSSDSGGSGGGTPKASGSAGTSAGVMSFNVGAVRLGGWQPQLWLAHSCCSESERGFLSKIEVMRATCKSFHKSKVSACSRQHCQMMEQVKKVVDTVIPFQFVCYIS